MTFEEWFNEIEGYATRGERFGDDWVLAKSGVAMGKDWLLAAYNAGYKQGQSTLSGVDGAPTPPYVKYPTTSNPNPYPNPYKEIHHSTWPNIRTCSKCGITLEGVMGYVCYDGDCPTFVRVSSAAFPTVDSTGVYGYSEGVGMGELK